MAIYHLSTKPISRSSGRSAVASIAYRAGIKITDERLGKTYDYTKRKGVIFKKMILPINEKITSSELWNLAEKTETRKNSRTAREIVINIPHELMQGDQGKKLVNQFAEQLSKKYGIAIDYAIHAPDKQGDQRNYHAHLLLTTRQLEQNQHGKVILGKKSQLEMSNTQLKQAGLLSNQDELKQIRKEWADLANEYLAEQGIDEHIDHRSHADRGLDTLPTVKMGWQATELERKGIRTDVGDQNRAIKAYNEQILAQKQAENELKKSQKSTKKHKTHENAQKGTLHSDKNNLATLVPNTHIKSHTSENRAICEHKKPKTKTINEQRVIWEEFLHQIAKLAEQIFAKQKQDLVAKSKPLLADFEQLRDNKPLFFGKDRWEQDKQTALDKYNTVKDEFDKLKAQGVTQEHKEQATTQLQATKPEFYQQAMLAKEQLDKHERQEKQTIARNYGADLYAETDNPTTYHGKIVSIKNGVAIQETKDGKVLHPLTNTDFIVGKEYTVHYEQGLAQVRQDYDLSRYLTKDKNHDKKR